MDYERVVYRALGAPDILTPGGKRSYAIRTLRAASETDPDRSPSSDTVADSVLDVVVSMLETGQLDAFLSGGASDTSHVIGEVQAGLLHGHDHDTLAWLQTSRPMITAMLQTLKDFVITHPFSGPDFDYDRPPPTREFHEAVPPTPSTPQLTWE